MRIKGEVRGCVEGRSGRGKQRPHENRVLGGRLLGPNRRCPAGESVREVVRPTLRAEAALYLGHEKKILTRAQQATRITGQRILARNARRKAKDAARRMAEPRPESRDYLGKLWMAAVSLS